MELKFEDGQVSAVVPAALQADILRRHALVNHALVPAARGDGDRLIFSVSADLTLRDAFAYCRDDQTLRYSYGVSAYIGLTVAETLDALHGQAREALGSFDWRHVLVTREGTLAVILHAAETPDTRAPEVSLGETPTPASDVYALWKALQPLFAIVDAPPPLQETVLGEHGTAAASHLAQFGEVQAKASASRRSDRYQDIPTALAAWRSLWDKLGIGPDEAATKSLLLEMTARHANAPPPVAGPTLVLGTNTRWVTTPTGKSLDLHSHAACRRLIDYLCTRSEARDTSPIDAETLIGVGWPGEEVTDASRERFQNTVSKLRSLGFDEVLEFTDGGYRILPDIRVRR